MSPIITGVIVIPSSAALNCQSAVMTRAAAKKAAMILTGFNAFTRWLAASP
jgi:hypothetical protein